MKEYASGATRNNRDHKFNYEGFLSPLVLRTFASYMHEHRKQGDGKLRAADNWQHGIDRNDYMESLVRHVIDIWTLHRGHAVFCPDDGHKLNAEELCSAIMFNIMGYLHETIKRGELDV